MSSGSLDMHQIENEIIHQTYLRRGVNTMSTSITNSNFRDTINKAEPAVSVVVPYRNEKDHIEAVLQSILVQESLAGGFEVIVTDGMSNDGTRDILLRLSEEESRLPVVDNPV
jgi:cellulose synthase/poly-beta-1,6-N-acetylglucosamine synthase-like glycosyltransferase